MTALTINAQPRTLNIPTTSRVMLSKAKHLGSEILRFAQNDSLNAKRSSSAFLRKSGRGLILFLTNQRQLFALDDCAVDRHFGNVFATWHIVHDVEHDALQQRTQRARACACRAGLS